MSQDRGLAGARPGAEPSNTRSARCITSQAGPQLLRDRRMFGQQPLGIGGAAGFEFGQVEVENSRHLGVFGCRNASTIADQEFVAAHEWSRNDWLRRSIARFQSTRVAPGERPIRTAI